MLNDRRGRSARAEMGPKGYLQVKELADKLTKETGRKVTVNALKAHWVRGRIDGVFHEPSNLWFFKADTKLPKRMPKVPKPRVEENSEPILQGPWVTWPAPGFVRMGKRNYLVWGSRDWGWLGGVQ